jgi:DedD protein
MARPMARQRGKGGGDGGGRLLLGGGLLVVLAVTFALGIAVGRKWSSHREAEQTAAEPAARKSTPPTARRSGLTEPIPERAAQEKLTFYQTLTAPMNAVPAPTSVSASAKAEPAKPRPERPADRPAPPSPSKPDKPPAPAERPSPPRAPDARTGDWAVQVGVFKDRSLAENVRRPLAASGLDAYLVAVPDASGQTQYKVRMGTFKTREEAARMAERVRQERSLTAFATPK